MQIRDRIYFYKGREEDKIIRGAGSCNVVVVKTKQQVMIDSGLIVGGSFRRLMKAAKADGIDLRQTRAVLHTHSHWDHITGDCVLQWKHKTKIYAHRWGRPSIESQSTAFKSFILDTGEFYKEIIGTPAFVIKLLLWYVGGSYSGICVDETLDGCEELDFGIRVTTHHTPGHTPGHIGYYFPEEKVFVGGDLIDLETGNGADLNNPHSNYADGLASLELVSKLDIEYYLPAHGQPVRGKENVQKLFDRMIKNTHKYVSDVTGFLSKRDGTLTDIFDRLFPGTPFTLKAMKMMQIWTVLKHLEEKGEVTRTKGDKIVWSLAK